MGRGWFVLRILGVGGVIEDPVEMRRLKAYGRFVWECIDQYGMDLKFQVTMLESMEAGANKFRAENPSVENSEKSVFEHIDADFASGSARAVIDTINEFSEGDVEESVEESAEEIVEVTEPDDDAEEDSEEEHEEPHPF